MSPEPSAVEPEAAGSTAREGKRRRRTAPFIALAVAVVVGGLFVVLARSDSTKRDIVTAFAVGHPAPRIVSTTLDGSTFDLSRRKGSWVVLNFFSTTCLPCKAEHPELVAFADQQRSLGAAGAELYTVVNQISNDDSDQNVRAYFTKNGGDWPVVRDRNGTIAVSLGVAQVPETWIVDPQGVVVQRIPATITADALSRDIQQLREANG